MRRRTCCFVGDRNIPVDKAEEVSRNLEQTFHQMTSQGVTYFCISALPGFSMMAAETVIRLRETHPCVTLTLYMPVSCGVSKWSDEDNERFEAVYNSVDKVTLVSERYSREHKPKSIRNMMDHSAYCVFYYTDSGEESAHALSYAVRRGLNMIDLAAMQGESSIQSKSV